MRLSAIALAAVVLAAPAWAQEGNLSAWVQYTQKGAVEARVVTASADCPDLVIDGTPSKMQLRAAPSSDFPVHVCARSIPTGAKAVSLAAQTLPVPVADPQRIMVFGDTGCRIKGSVIQDCNDPRQWPFPQIAAQAAKLKPDLVIHVGDFLYRESPCPKDDKRCAGTPWGDNWRAWSTDFFAPAAPLLAAAPWVIARGNHEDCERSGAGWLRLLGPQAHNPIAGCIGHLPLYTVPLGQLDLAVMDNADAPDTTVDADLRTEYEADFSALGQTKKPTWLVMHRPIWGAVTLFGMGVGGNRTLIAALPDPHVLDNVALMVAGHIHTFEALNYEDKLPPALVAGFGGDALDAAPPDLAGVDLSGTRVKDGISIGGFGFLLMTREGKGWRIDVHKMNGAIERVCRFAGGRLDCPKA